MIFLFFFKRNFSINKFPQRFSVFCESFFCEMLKFQLFHVKHYERHHKYNVLIHRLLLIEWLSANWVGLFVAISRSGFASLNDSLVNIIYFSWKNLSADSLIIQCVASEVKEKIRIWSPCLVYIRLENGFKF